MGLIQRRFSMGDSLALDTGLVGVVLAAGAGARLRPLTGVLPKAMCPVNGVPMVDLALDRVRAVTPAVAVNIHHGRDALEPHVAGRAHLSIEPEALGTAGALARLRSWIDGRDVLVHNADSWHDADVGAFVAGWQRDRPRLLTVIRDRPADFGWREYAGLALLPWRDVAALPEEPAGLYEVSWRGRQSGDLELVGHAGRFVDCGTPARYLAANLMASEGRSVVAPDARVEGDVHETVVWSGARVWPGERLHRAIRARQDITVFVR